MSSCDKIECKLWLIESKQLARLHNWQNKGDLRVWKIAKGGKSDPTPHP